LAANPFSIAQKEDVFVARKLEKLQRQDERAWEQNCGVADKSTFTSRVTYPNSNKYLDGKSEPGVRAGGLNLIHRPKGGPSDTGTSPRQPWGGRGGMLTVAGTGKGPSEFRRVEKESMHDFISKKREIFFVQMQLDSKQEEIRRLEQDTVAREEQVRNNEAMLEEDALRFDSFLKENDLKVQEAVKRADAETKAKMEQIQEIKRLTGEIESMTSELSKFEEQLDDCKHYKAFIDSLTPPEFFEEQETKRKIRQRRKIEEWEAEVLKVREIKKAAAARRRQADIDYENAKSQQAAERSEQEIKDSQAALDEAEKLVEPPPPGEQEEGEEVDEIPEIYFTRPKQLLDKYKEMEGKNLFLIQNVQELEEALEDLSSKAEVSRQAMHGKISTLQQQEHELDLELAAEKERIEELQRRMNVAGDTSDKGSGHFSSDDGIVAAVRSVYTHIGFESDNAAGVLTMLTNIENKVEEYLRDVNSMAVEFVEVAEKACEKERRKLQREEKVEEQRLERESRLKLAMERANAPIKKRQGKPEMFRSQPFRKKEVVDAAESKRDLEQEELERFLARMD